MPQAIDLPVPTFDLFHPSATSISVSGEHFVDPHGRVLHLRGANVGSASKTPMRPCPPFHLSKKATYVGRPFPLDEADAQWRRLRSWGLTFARINVTWEALEHAGPGQYDKEYLDYLRKLLISMHENGVAGYIVIHQDVFSRYCGGSGAPGWVVEAAGFDLSDDGEKLALSGSAFLDGLRGGRLEGERGLWPTGYQKLACATMNTLFWGGEIFAPSLKVSAKDGRKVNIQRYLQDAFLAAIDKLVATVGDLPGVMGFELMNEPHPGFIGLASINEWNYNTDLHLGQFPSPLQSFSLGTGHPTKVPLYVRSFPYPTRKSRSVTANPKGVSVWRPDGSTKGECPWEKEGVWRWSEQKKRGVALQEDYFAKDRQGRKVDFYEDFYFPFVRRWEEVISKRAAGKARMVEAVPNEYCPDWPEEERPKNFVYAPHWYDLNAMFKKSFGTMTVNVQGLSRGMFFAKALYFGRGGAKKNYAVQISTLVSEARKQLGDVPIVFGECGIPMDLNNEKAFQTGDFKWQERMMDALISGLESSMVGFNLWAFNPHNTDAIGDDWNAENFSWYSNHFRDAEIAKRGLKADSEEVENDLSIGGRLLNVIVRPYAIATAGTPLEMQYEATASSFTYRWTSPVRFAAVGGTEADSPPSAGEITEIFLPKRAFPQATTRFLVSPGGRVFLDWERERLWVWFVDQRPYRLAPVTEKVRRIDLWVEGKDEKAGYNKFVVMIIGLVLYGAIASVYYGLMMEWKVDRRMGMKMQGKLWLN